MGKFPFSSRNKLALVFALIGLMTVACEGFAISAKVVGQIESVYLKRASMRIIEVSGTASETAPLKVGQKVSFMLPPEDKKSKSRDKIEYGKFVEADLLGSPITEYGEADKKIIDPDAGEPSSVYVWTATRVAKVKNQKQYLGEGPSKGKKRRGKKDKKSKDEPDKIWTQEETVRGKVLIKSNRLYIKEENLAPRDRGLDVISDDWYEKLKDFSGRDIVVHGTTNRVSPSSGTIDISSLIKIYPK